MPLPPMLLLPVVPVPVLPPIDGLDAPEPRIVPLEELLPASLYSGMALSSSRLSAVCSFASSPVPDSVNWLHGTATSWDPMPRNPPTETTTLPASIFDTVPILSPCAFVTGFPTMKLGGALDDSPVCNDPGVAEPGALIDDGVSGVAGRPTSWVLEWPDAAGSGAVPVDIVSSAA
jgi:hypothetical protein